MNRPLDSVGMVPARLLRAGFLFLLIGSCMAATARAAESDYAYRVAAGDTLIGLSGQLLIAPEDWPKVARHNRLANPNYLVPGSDLRIPFSMLKFTPVTVSVAHVEGDVSVVTGQAKPMVLTPGTTLGEGAQVITGKNGYATLKLRDDSLLRVQALTQVQVERMRLYAGVELLESVFKVINGRVESLVNKLRPRATRQDIQTPLATMGVRGTEFRVTMDEQNKEARGEVLEGTVAVAAAGASSAEKRLTAGFGSVVDATSRVSDPVALLAAPDISRLPKLQERTLLRFALAPQTGAKSYRAQLARDATFNSVVAEMVSASPELRFINIADGSYFLRVRALDAHRLEGRDAMHAFTLKARPEPPLISTPAPKGKVRANAVEFKWAENIEAATYHLQVAQEAAFKTISFEDKAIQGGQATVASLPLGQYFWRVASLRKDGDRGPYGDVASFVLMAPPAAPEPPQVGEGDVQFRWSGEPGQKFDFQLADDNKFSRIILTRSLEQPAITVPRPKPGTYFMRYRATDADGFVGPFSSAQTFRVIEYGCISDADSPSIAVTRPDVTWSRCGFSAPIR